MKIEIYDKKKKHIMYIYDKYIMEHIRSLLKI